MMCNAIHEKKKNSWRLVWSASFGINFHISSSLELSLLPRLCNMFKGEADRLYGPAFLNVERRLFLWRISPAESTTHMHHYLCAGWAKTLPVTLSFGKVAQGPDVSTVFGSSGGSNWTGTLLCGVKVRKTNDAKIHNKWWVMLLPTQPYLYVSPSNDKVQQPVLMRVWFGCQGHIRSLPISNHITLSIIVIFLIITCQAFRHLVEDLFMNYGVAM